MSYDFVVAIMTVILKITDGGTLVFIPNGAFERHVEKKFRWSALYHKKIIFAFQKKKSIHPFKHVHFPQFIQLQKHFTCTAAGFDSIYPAWLIYISACVVYSLLFRTHTVPILT